MIIRTALFAALVAPHFADAQPKEQYTYRCTGKDGKKYYGQTIPQACLGQPMELINKQGLVVKRIDPEGEEKARIAKEEQEKKKKELEAAKQEQMRRSRALLATYTSEKDIEDARARAMRDHQNQLKDVERKIEDIKKRQAKFQKELAMYEEAGKGAPPQRLKEEVTNAEIDLKAQEGLLDAKKKEAVGINARYDEDRRRYREATGAPTRASSK